MTDLSGFTPNVEAVSGYEPDLVVVADDPAGLTDALAPLGIPVLSLPAATMFDDVYAERPWHLDEQCEACVNGPRAKRGH